MMTGGDYPGFWSAELIPPAHDCLQNWTLIQKFKTNDQAIAWQQSDSLKELMARNNSSEGSRAVIVHEEISKDASTGVVATAIVTNVFPQHLDLFKKWEKKIQLAQAKFPGYKGTYWQPPVLENGTQFTTLLRFETPDALEQWMESAERKQLLNDVNKIVASTKFSSLTSSFPGWFPADPETGEQPPNWKTSLLVLAALYPIIMFCIRCVGPFFSSSNFALYNFVSTVINMVLVTWVCLPILIKLFTKWLFPNPESKVITTWIGLIILFAIYAVEIDIFWNP
jgi:antibiotic biosynthesis monooxygenase (ABM) superfamily enzyme